MRDHALSALPYPIRVVVGLLAYRKAMAMLYGQGTGRFTREEIAAFRAEIWQTFSDLLADVRPRSLRHRPSDDEPFWVLGGGEPTEADCVLFSFIVSVLVCDAYVISHSHPLFVFSAAVLACRRHGQVLFFC